MLGGTGIGRLVGKSDGFTTPPVDITRGHTPEEGWYGPGGTGVPGQPGYSPPRPPNGGLGGPGNGPAPGPTDPSPTTPGGSAGGSPLDALSHTTAGLNWSHLALWLAILLGGYVVLGSLATGKGLPGIGKGRKR